MSWDGKVAETFTDRLQRAASSGTGCLEVHDAARERRGWVFLEEREVVSVLVDGYQPRLARRLTVSELVSVADMGEVLAVTKDEYDPRIAVECVARGLVDPVTMKVLYREFMLSAASFVDEWEMGDSQWVAGIPPWEGRSTAVPVPLLVSAMSRRKEHWAGLWTELSAVTIPDRVPVRTGPLEYRPATADEAAVLWAVDGRRTLDQVAGECGFTRFQAGHLVATLMTKKMLDLFPVNDPRPTSSFLRVEAGYYPASQPVPDLNVPVAVVVTHEPPPVQVAASRPWVVQMATSVPRPSEACPESTHETTHVAVTGPVTADDPEGNVVSRHEEIEDADGAVPEGSPATAVVQQRDLPRLPFRTAEPSGFSEAPPSALARRPGGGLATGVEPDSEVLGLRDEVLRLATERKAAVEHAAVLREQALLHSAQADAAAVLVEEAGKSIARLTKVTSEASSMAVGQFEGLQLASREDARIAALRAQVEEDAEKARKALVLSQNNFDESSAVHANLQRDLQVQKAHRETLVQAWTAAADGATGSSASARHAETAAAECDQLIEEARERLIEMANADQ